MTFINLLSIVFCNKSPLFNTGGGFFHYSAKDPLVFVVVVLVLVVVVVVVVVVLLETTSLKLTGTTLPDTANCFEEKEPMFDFALAAKTDEATPTPRAATNNNFFIKNVF